MTLREILKIDTSTSAQAKMNDYHEQKQKKIVIENNSEDKEEVEGNSEMGSSSLLSDPTLFQEFQNSIFKTENGSLKGKLKKMMWVIRNLRVTIQLNHELHVDYND